LIHRLRQRIVLQRLYKVDGCQMLLIEVWGKARPEVGHGHHQIGAVGDVAQLANQAAAKNGVERRRVVGHYFTPQLNQVAPLISVLSSPLRPRMPGMTTRAAWARVGEGGVVVRGGYSR
jgi:hypothetical protein